MSENTTNLQLSQISHELANPVTIIYSSLKLLEKEYPEIISLPHWNGIMDEVHHMQHLLEDLRLTQLSGNVHMSAFSYEDFAQGMVHSLYPYLKNRNQTLLLQCASTLSELVADQSRLRQVVENLIKNASEASPDNAMIAWRIYTDHDMLINEIIDTGCGIAPEYEAAIFNPFVTSKPSGTGLGLPICKQIIESHSGTISYRKNPSCGTTFTFCLPIP